MDTRPLLDVTNLKCSVSLYTDRKKQMKKRLMMDRTKQEKRRVYYVLSKYRAKQKLLLESGSIEDPDPYSPSYVFYCFTGDESE